MIKVQLLTCFVETIFFYKFDFMRRCIIIISLLMLMFPALNSCWKDDGYDIDASGTIFSKHRIPTPRVKIELVFAQGGKDQDAFSITSVTDTNGFFVIRKKARRRLSQTTVEYLKRIVIDTRDSGTYAGGLDLKTKDQQIFLK